MIAKLIRIEMAIDHMGAITPCGRSLWGCGGGGSNSSLGGSTVVSCD